MNNISDVYKDARKPKNVCWYIKALRKIRQIPYEITILYNLQLSKTYQ